MKRTHNNIVVLTGVSASGKDFLLGKATESNISNGDIHIVPFGTLLFERIRASLPGTDNRDALRNTDPELITTCARKIIEEVVETEGTAVINTHVAYKSGDTITVNPLMDSLLMPRDYIFVSADPEEIAWRRQQDESRQREAESEETIALHQDIALGVVSAIARRLDSGLTVVENHVHNTAQNIQTMQEVLYG